MGEEEGSGKVIAIFYFTERGVTKYLDFCITFFLNGALPRFLNNGYQLIFFEWPDNVPRAVVKTIYPPLAQTVR